MIRYSGTPTPPGPPYPQFFLSGFRQFPWAGRTGVGGTCPSWLRYCTIHMPIWMGFHDLKQKQPYIRLSPKKDRLSRICAVAQYVHYVVLEANARSQWERPIFAPSPLRNPSINFDVMSNILLCPPGSWCAKLVGIDSAVTDLRMREKTRFVWIFLLTYLSICLGRLKIRDMKIRDGQKCRTWKCETWICGTSLHGWKLWDIKMRDHFAGV